MSGLPAFPREPIQLPTANALVTKARAFHPKFQSFAFLVVSACFFGFSRYCHNHLEDEGMYFLDAFLFFLLLIVAPGGVVRTRQRVVGGLKRCGFLICKGLATIIFFAMFRELGNKLLAEKDVYVALASIFFFIHLLFLQEIHEITDDLGIAQGVLFAAFTLLVAEYPKLSHVLFLSGIFSVLLAMMNTRKPPAAPETPQAAAAETPQVAVEMPQVAAAEITQVAA